MLGHGVFHWSGAQVRVRTTVARAGRGKGRGRLRGMTKDSAANAKAGDDEPWSLAAEVPPLPGSEAAAGYEVVRPLPPAELAQIRAAGELLRRLTVASPHQRLLDRYEVLERALREGLEPATEGRDARLARASDALRSWAQQADELPARIAASFADVIRDGTTAACAAWRDAKARQVCAAVAIGGTIRLSEDGRLLAVLPAVSPRDAAATVAVGKLIDVVLRASERIHCRVLVDAEPDLHEASRRLRALESEVLLGEPLLLQTCGTTINMQDLHADVRTTAEVAVRVAKEVLARRTTAAEGAEPDPDPDAVAAEPATEAVGQGAAPEMAAAEAASPGEAPAEGAPRDGAAEGAEADVEPALPPVDLAAVAGMLAASVSELERVWSDAVAPDGALGAGERDQQRFGSVAAALLRQTEEEDERRRTSGTGTLLGFPISDDELEALDPEQPTERSDGHLLPPLYVLQAFLHELRALPQPRKIIFGEDGAVRHLAFDPGAVARLQAQALLLARCAEASTSMADAGADAAWLRAAVLRAFDAGLPEAVVLYAHLLATAGGDMRGLGSVTARVCAHLAAGGTAHDTLPVTVPLAHHLMEVIVDDDGPVGDGPKDDGPQSDGPQGDAVEATEEYRR